MSYKEPKPEKEFGLIFWTHLLLILLFWSLPFLVDWKLVFLSVIIYYLQRYIRKFWYDICPLTEIQFNTKDTDFSFYYYYLRRLGLPVEKRKVRFTVTWLIPWIILVVALLWQIVLNVKPII